MTHDTLMPLIIDSTMKTVLDPRMTAGEVVGGIIGSTFGPVGYFVGGTLGRMLEATLFD
jgi:hypothetical protein